MTVSPRTRRMLSLTIAVSLGLGGAIAVALPASAATLTITSAADSGPGTLRQAILDANTGPGADTIVFALPGSPAITLATALPEITDSLTITGPTGGIVVDGSAVATGDGLQALACGSTIDLALTDLTLSGFPGDGIATDCTDLTLTRVTSTTNGDNGVTMNLASGTTAALTDITASDNAFDGISLTSTDTGSDATLTRVTASSNQGGVGLDSNVDLGAKLTVTDSTFETNAAGGMGTFAGVGSVVAVAGSTFSGNDPASTSSVGGITANTGGGTITIDDTEIADNHAVVGAGISITQISAAGTIAITNSRILRNAASFSGFGLGGGLYLGQIDDAASRLTISDSTFSGNSSALEGGGMYLQSVGNGGPAGGLSILRTTVEGNSSDTGGGISIEGWGTPSTPGTPIVDIESSTISGNTAQEGAGLIASDSGSSGPDSLVLVQNSTISGNTGSNGTGGLALFGGGTGSVIRVAHSTIASNTGSGEAGGIFALTPVNLDLDHTVVAGNGASDVQLDDPATVLTSTWSLVQNPDATTLAALNPGTGNLKNVDAELGPLADNGGPTLTMLPAATSPLIDAGNPAITGAPATDQRGRTRIVRTIDIGAVEVQGVAPAALAATGATPAPLALGGILLLAVGTLLVVGRRRRPVRSAG